MDHVTVRHPAVVSFVPQRGRIERVSLAQVETPVMLRTAHEDEFAVLDWSVGLHENPGRATYLHEGRLWSRMLKGKGDALAHVTPDDLRAYLEDDGRTDVSLLASFTGTPIAAVHDGAIRNGSTTNQGFRGGHVDIERARTVTVDWRGSAGNDVRDHLDRNVRIVGNSVFERRRILISLSNISTDGGYGDYLLTGIGTPAFNDIVTSRDTLTSALDTLDRERWAAGRHARDQGTRIRDYMASVPKGASAGDEVAYAVNGHAWPILGLIRIQADRLEDARDPCASVLRNLEATLRPLWMRSLTRTLGRDDPAADVLALANALDTLMEASDPKRTSRFVEERMRRTMREFYLPAASPEPDAADVAAMSAF